MDWNEGTVGTQTSHAGPEGPAQPGIATFEVDGERFAVLSVPLVDDGVLDVLTKAEREVAVLAAAGLDNATIARSRGTSLRTTANQMASVLSKMGVGSRYELSARLALVSLDGDRP